MGEHAFPLTGFLCTTAHVTFGARGGAGGFLLVSCLPMCEQKINNEKGYFFSSPTQRCRHLGYMYDHVLQM